MRTFIKMAHEKGLKIVTNFPLSRITTFRIGGPAKYYLKVTTAEQLIEALRLAREFEIPFKVLGNGSNVLFSDTGFDGFIIHNLSDSFRQIVSANNIKPKIFPEYVEPFKLNRKNFQPVIISVSSGMRLPSLIRRLHRQKILGLEWFAGIPATVGGAVYMNAHGGPYFFGDFMHSARIFDGQDVKTVSQEYFRFAYDYSILHETGAIVLDVLFYGWQGDISMAQKFYKYWASQKRIQPQSSAGCIFQNLQPDDQHRLNLPTPSVGYFIDKVLGLKGVRQADAIISNAHAAFIENLGKASATDVLFLIKRIKNEALQKANVRLKLEIELIGFKENLIFEK